MKRPIYLDNHSTTQLDPRVLDSILPYFKEKYGNASSIDHFYGNEAVKAVNESKERISSLLKSDPEEIIFTSGATESNNIALIGTAEALKEKGNHIIITEIEHKSILDVCKNLESRGFRISKLKVNRDGDLDLDELKKLICKETIMISIMAANNEIGKINPLNEIGKIAKERGIIFHTDAAQAFGHIPINLKETNIDLLSASAHKIYGPKGIGLLYVKRGFKPHPIVFGGGQERNIRSGTLNVPGIVGFGVAAEIAQKEIKKTSERLFKLRNKLYEALISRDEIEINGSMKNRLNHNLSISIKGIEAKALIHELKDVLAISTGSACTADNISPSHVIKALGYNEDRAFSTIRFGLGKFTTEEEIKTTIEKLVQTINKLRNL